MDWVSGMVSDSVVAPVLGKTDWPLCVGSVNEESRSISGAAGGAGFLMELPVTWGMPGVVVCEKALLEIIEGIMVINADNIAITRIFLVVIVM
jgi:hypothetical protein